MTSSSAMTSSSGMASSSGIPIHCIPSNSSVPSPANEASDQQVALASTYLLDRTKTIVHIISGYAVRLWGVKLVLLCTLIYGILHCSLYSNEDSMYCTGKILLMHWVSYYMCWASIFKIAGVILLYKFVRALTFNILVVAVFSSGITLVVTVTSLALSTVIFIKLLSGFVRRISGF